MNTNVIFHLDLALALALEQTAFVKFSVSREQNPMREKVLKRHVRDMCHRASVANVAIIVNREPDPM